MNRALALLLLLSLLSLPVMADEAVNLNPTGRDINLQSLMRLQDSPIGDVELTITADQNIELPATSTLALLADSIVPEVLLALAALQQDDVLDQVDFSKVGLILTFDMSTLELIMQAPEEALKVNSLTFAASNNNRRYIDASTLSGYMNLYVSASNTENVGDDSKSTIDYNHLVEAGLNYENALLEYEGVYNHYDGRGGGYSRQGTRLNIDFPDQGTRMVLGDMYSRPNGFQAGVDFLGFGISRDFSLIPTRNVRPTAARQFTLERTSEVDVLIDGVVVKRLSLGAGSYNLEDIPLAEGVSDVELVITDRNGRKERINFSIATGMDLLKPGEFEYAFSSGVASALEADELKYDNDLFITGGMFEYGVSPSLTLGVNFQATEKQYQVGQRSLFATGLGIFDFNLGYSYQDVIGDGAAASLGFDVVFEPDMSNKQLSFFYEYFSESFSRVDDLFPDQDDFVTNPINLLPELNVNRNFFTGRYSQSITQALRVSLTLSYVDAYEEQGDYWTVSPALSGDLFDTEATWSVRLTHKEREDDENEFNALLTLSWPFGDSSRVVSSYSSDTEELQSEYSYLHGIGKTGGINMFVGAKRTQDTDANLEAGIDYTANRYSLNVQHTSRFNDFSDDKSSHFSRAELSSALVFSGSNFAIGRTIGDSFAIIKPYSNLSTNRIDVDMSEEGSRVYSDGLGAMVVPDLPAYSEQLLSYDVTDLPPGYDLGEGVFALNPGFKQGYALKVGSDAIITAMGSLIDKQTGEPISLLAGKAISQTDKNFEVLDFFTNRSGRFAISGLKPGTYLLKLNSKEEKMYQLVIKDDSEALLRLGKLYID
ncbi:fimbria/pilus outer membrane usher protein [Shewanella donghaensis]|uniref:fimbria/pilus outer membrane usher protein n=1 Tax=Shewanella donghaensis TaxID=238836 RepID=UPI001183CDA0|nr:fimbria/pilus outer membrane usher protein [Shewanella donghaensis]